MVLLLLLLCISPAPAAIRITEFMAENDGFLHDADGDSPDWVEIHNDSTSPASLTGWRLTDTPTNLTKWTFPSLTLGPDSYVIVFTSGKDRALPGAELHANFQLDNAGEFLALVQPDGVTIASAWSPFPPQRANASFGTGREVTVTTLIATGAVARWMVPSNGSLGAAWQLPGFTDTAWSSGPLGLGYDTGTATNSSGTVVLSLDFNERGNNPGTTETGFSAFIINSNVSATAIQTNATVRTYGALTLTLSNTAPNGYDDRLRTTPVNSGAFTESLLLRDFVFSRSVSDTGGLDLLIAGLLASQPYRMSLWSFDSSSTGARISDWFANGLLVRSDYIFDGSVLPTSNDDYRFDFTTISSATGQLLIQGRRNFASVANQPAVFLNALRLTQVGLRPLIVTDVESAMRDRNASIYLRVPFQVAAPAAVQRLKLRMKYDDGYAAYLNGQLVAARNITNTITWNAVADAPRPPTQATEYEDILFDVPESLLLPGTNILALQGLNVSASDTDFLIAPELHWLQIQEFTNHYFKPATPGAENGPGYLGFVEDTKFSVDRGFYDTAFTVAITSATASATIYWTVNGAPPTPATGQVYTEPLLITNTAFLRAAAFAPALIPSDVDTHTYIFLSQVLRQPAVLPGYPTNWQANYPADYEMDSNVVNSPQYSSTISNDLRAIPTLSLVTEHLGLWGSSTGIYPNAVNAGEAWERSASAELLLPGGANGLTAFAVNCGLRMQGNASRDNNRLAKHSFRLLFKSDYGPSKLRYDWFPNSPVEQFDNMILRACFTDSWATRYSDQTPIPGGKGTRYRPEDSIYLRDVWMKDSQLDMGHPSPRNTFVHLYINGLYWGLYNPCERVDAAFCAEYFGGRQIDWDVLAGDAIYDYATLKDGRKDDWNDMLAIANAGITNETAYQALAALVDIENLIDFMLLHIFAEAEDWPAHNWYVAHRRTNTNGLPATKWQFLIWDQEIVLDQLVRRNRVDVNNNDTPARIYSQLRAFPEFCRLFGDRVQQHLFNQGALTPSNNIARLMARAAEIDRAIVGESARWGDAREFTIGSNPGHGQTFTRDEWWVPELQKLYTNFFPSLNATNLERFRAAGLYPALSPPDLNQFGGAVTGGFQMVLTQTNPSGTIFFTLDGADPRLWGMGGVSPSAQSYSGPVPINSPTLVRARVLDGANWSALIEVIFYPPQDLSKLVLSELMYNPPQLGTNSGDEFEFVELRNCGTNQLNLSGLTFSDGISFTFTNGTLLNPGEFFLLVRNPDAFSSKYPGVTFQGIYSNKLDNGGERLTLSHPLGATVFSVSYDDTAPWPVAADNYGFSLVPKNPCAFQASDKAENWRASANIGGSPGAEDPETALAPIVINEILSSSVLPQVDAIELYNPTLTNVDIGGWFLTDTPGDPKKFRVPSGVTIPANGFVVFTESNFNAAPTMSNNFALNGAGEVVCLFSGDAQTNLTGYSHGFSFDASDPGITFGRYVNTVGEEFFPAQVATTFNDRNAGPQIGPVVINEIHYHPASEGDEFVELQNITSAAVPLFYTPRPAYTWRLSGLGYAFPTNVTLPPDGLLLLVATNPAAFRAKYSVPDSVLILGPWTGVLQDSGERLALQRPGWIQTNFQLAWITVDEVRYNDKNPWPPSADGGGPSLQRRDPLVYANEPLNWAAVPPTPGLTNCLQEVDTDADGLPDIWEVANQTDPNVPDASLDPDGDGLTNTQEYQAGTDPHNADSALRFEPVWLTDNGTQMVLSFVAQAQKSYSIECGDAVDAPAAMLTLISFDAVSTNRLIFFTNEISTNVLQRFYRLKTPWNPPGVLKLNSASISNDIVRFCFSTEASLAYRVEYQHQLGAPQWTTFLNSPAQPAPSVIWVTNQQAPGSNYFYRVVAN